MAPHCDELVLHAPGECEYCDRYPAEQQKRIRKSINFTDHEDPEKLPCPAMVRRSADVINRWGGNRAYGNEARAEELLIALEAAGSVVCSRCGHDIDREHFLSAFGHEVICPLDQDFTIQDVHESYTKHNTRSFGEFLKKWRDRNK